MSICVPAFHTSPPLRPTPPPGGREASASARHAATHHAAGQAVRHIKGFLAQTSITPLPYHARASRVWHAKCSAMACPFACHLFKPASQTHCSTQALLGQGSNGFCSLMWPPIMQQVVSYKASSRIPPSPLFPTRLEHPESGMQNVLLWHDVLCACVFHTSPPQRPTAPPQRS